MAEFLLRDIEVLAIFKSISHRMKGSYSKVTLWEKKSIKIQARERSFDLLPAFNLLSVYLAKNGFNSYSLSARHCCRSIWLRRDKKTALLGYPPPLFTFKTHVAQSCDIRFASPSSTVFPISRISYREVRRKKKKKLLPTAKISYFSTLFLSISNL